MRKLEYPTGDAAKGDAWRVTWRTVGSDFRPGTWASSRARQFTAATVQLNLTRST